MHHNRVNSSKEEKEFVLIAKKSRAEVTKTPSQKKTQTTKKTSSSQEQTGYYSNAAMGLRTIIERRNSEFTLIRGQT